MTDNRITVTGHAQVHVAPAVATWHLTIEVTDRQARVAYERCAEQATSIIEGLKASADIETSRCPPWRSARASPRLRARRLNADGAPRAKARRPGPAGGECPPRGQPLIVKSTASMLEAPIACRSFWSTSPSWSESGTSFGASLRTPSWLVSAAIAT